MAQFNKFIPFQLCFAIFLIGMSCVLQAQNPLDLLSQEKPFTQYKPPAVNKLTSNWWQTAIQAAPQDQPYTQLRLWSEQLLAQLKQQANLFSIEDSQAIKQFHTNVQELQKRVAEQISPDGLVFEDKQPYLLDDAFNRLRELRLLNQQLTDRTDAADDFTADAKQQREQIDVLVIQYGALSIDAPERKHIGFMWMAYRSWVALNEMHAEHATSQKAHTEHNILALKTHIDKMRTDVQPNSESVEALERQIQINTAALKSTQNTVLQSSQTIAQSQGNDELSGLELDINKLRLVQHIMSQKRLELALTRDNIHLDWIQNDLSSNNENKVIAQDQVLKSEQLILEINKQMDQWRLMAQDLLLAPAGHLLEASEAKKAYEKRTELAQRVILGLGEISLQQDKVTFLLSLLTVQISEPQSGLSLWGSKIANFGASVINGIDAAANKPLFRINETPITLRPLLQLLIIILMGFILSKFARLILGRMESKRHADHSPLFFVLNKLIHYFIVIVAVIASFTTLGINLSNLTLIAGALSVGIGFGLQNLVSNFVSGLTIMFERSLKVGDYIELESGITGSVKEINARSTRINTNDNIDVVIPNSDLVTNQITNWTLRDSIKRVKIPFGVAYGTDKELVRSAAQEAAEKVPFTLTNMKGKEPEVWMTGFGDNSIDFVLLVWVSKYGVRRPNRIKASFLWELDNAFNKYSIEVPFPQRVIHHAKEVNKPDSTPTSID